MTGSLAPTTDRQDCSKQEAPGPALVCTPIPHPQSASVSYIPELRPPECDYPELTLVRLFSGDKLR